MTRRNRLGLRGRAGRGDRRRGQCRGRRLGAGRGRRLRAARPRHRRRLRLVAAAEARPAGARQGHLRRRAGPAPEAPGPQLHPQRRLPLRPDPDPLPHHPVRRRHRADGQAGRQARRHPRPRHLPQALPLPHLLLGRPQRGGGIAPPGRYKLRVKLLGQDRVLVPPGAIKLHRAQRQPAEARCEPTCAGSSALSDFLAGAGVLVAAAAAAAAILLPAGPPALGGDAGRARPLPGPDPRRPVAHPPDRRPARRHRPPRRARRSLGVAASAALAYVFRRWPILLPLAIVAALPFRVPLHAGGDTANLLVPLYLVIAGGVLATRRCQGLGAPPAGPARGASASDASCAGAVAPPADPPPGCLGPRRGRSPLRRCRRCTPRTSRRACRTSASSSSRSPGLRAAARRRVGPAAADLVLWVVAVEAVCFRPDRLGRVRDPRACSGTTR